MTCGSRLGPYEIVAWLGEGGMGEVYRAHDARLNRDVAVKVLPELFAADAERLARLTREAQTLASLNHPNIAHIHALEESDGVGALVMELVRQRSAMQPWRMRSSDAMRLGSTVSWLRGDRRKSSHFRRRGFLDVVEENVGRC